MATDNNFFTNKDWAKLQQQYVDAVSSFYTTEEYTSNSPLNNNAWTDAMEYWWKSVGGQLPDKNKQMFDTVLDQSRVFYSISEQFANMLGDISKQSKAPDDWKTIMNSHLENMKAMFDQYQCNSQIASMAPGMMPGMMWASPMDMWNQAISSILSDDSIDKILQMPGVGLTKDLQEKSQKTIRLWNDYQQNSQKYNATFAMLGKQALDRLGETILARAESDKKITSLKEIYNMWIDANEDVFAEYAKTEEYSKLYADLVNSLVKFKRHYNELTDDALKTFNMPTTEGVESIVKQQHVIKKELRDNKEAQVKLTAAMEKLQSELKGLKKDGPSTKQKMTSKKVSSNKKISKKVPGKKKAVTRTAAKPAARKTTAKKKSAKKSK